MRFKKFVVGFAIALSAASALNAVSHTAEENQLKTYSVESENHSMLSQVGETRAARSAAR